MAAAAPLAAAAIPAFEGLGMLGAAAAPALAAAAPAAAGLGAGVANAGLGAGMIPMGGGMIANLPVGAPTVLGSLGAGDLGMAGKALFGIGPAFQGAGAMGPYGEAIKTAGRAWQAGQMLGGQGQQPMQRRAPAMPMMPAPRPMGGAGQTPSPAQIAAWTRVNARNRNRRTMG